jgi:hypothetical protein
VSAIPLSRSAAAYVDFSVERLMRFLTALGQDVEIAVKAPARRRARGKLTVRAA